MTIEKRLHPGGVWPLTDADYEKLDPGIRRLVRFLVANRFLPTDSGDGKTKLAEFGSDLEGEILDTPHVFMSAELSEDGLADADRLLHTLERADVAIEPGMIQFMYDPADGSSIIMLSGVDDSMLAAPPNSVAQEDEAKP